VDWIKIKAPLYDGVRDIILPKAKTTISQTDWDGPGAVN
jgi:hypothetical protein